MRLHTNMRLLSGPSTDDVTDKRAFADFVLAIGDGVIGIQNDDVIDLSIPNDMLIPHVGDGIDAIVNQVYPNFVNVGLDPIYYQNRAILAPTNDIVDTINDYMADQLTGEDTTYISLDTPHSDTINSDRLDNVHSSKYLNTISTPGLPRHILRLKIGVPVMLLRNIDQSSGLCNGTRLIVTQLGKFVIEGMVISGNHIGQKVCIPRLSLTPSDIRIPFKFQRRQFPLCPLQ